MTKKIIYKAWIAVGLYMVLICLSCSKTRPEKYIAVTALNSNLVSTAYRPMFLNELMERKYKNQLPGTSAEEYVRDRAIKPVDEAIEKVKQLKETAETKELIAAALEVMTYGKTIFEHEYKSIAELIDKERPLEEIDKAITEMYDNTETGMAERFDRLDTLALKYARANKVPFDLI
ncbi:hypothetical protein GCM10023231_12050 [Olivibacter ginsenosidimutans]|uniref:Uncharacterized protein n=1 Tax=Olivibacter ginsenosidimutans TaxID=1176537 RepID=A0ABP9AU97_9SPHI